MEKREYEFVHSARLINHLNDTVDRVHEIVLQLIPFPPFPFVLLTFDLDEQPLSMRGQGHYVRRCPPVDHPFD